MVPELRLDDRASEAVEKALRRHLSNMTEWTVTCICSFSDETQPEALLKEMGSAKDEAYEKLLRMVSEMEDLLDENPSLLTGWRDVMVDRMHEQMARTFDTLCSRMETFASDIRSLALAQLCEMLDAEVLPHVATKMTAIGQGMLGRENAFKQSTVQSQLQACASRLCGRFACAEAARASATARACLWTVDWEDCTPVSTNEKGLQHARLFMPLVEQIRKHCHRVANVLSNEQRTFSSDVEGSSTNGHKLTSAVARAQTYGVEHGIEKMFKGRVAVYSVVSKRTVQAVLRVLCKGVMKAIVEGIRLQSLSSGAFAELQVACHALYVGIVSEGGHSNELDSLMEEMASSLHERSDNDQDVLSEADVIRMAYAIYNNDGQENIDHDKG